MAKTYVEKGFIHYCDYEFKITSDKERIIEGYASTSSIDSVNDIVLPSAFEKSLEKFLSGRGTLLFNHDPNQVVGPIIAAKIDNKGLYITAKVGKGWKTADEVWNMIKAGAVKGFSIGFIPKDAEYDHEKDVRIIKEVDLIEISVTPIPANADASFTFVGGKAIKIDYDIKEETEMEKKAVSPFMDLPVVDMSWDKRKAIKQCRKCASSDGSGNPDKIDFNKYKKCFMYYDEERKEELTAYKLPFVYIVDGKPKACKRAIMAIAAVLQGARGGVQIPEKDKEKIKKVVEHYYKKWNDVPPWKR